MPGVIKCDNRSYIYTIKLYSITITPELRYHHTVSIYTPQQGEKAHLDINPPLHTLTNEMHGHVL